MKFNEISQEDIKHLNPEQLVALLDILISSEIARTYQTGEVTHVSVPRPITVKDGGEDAKLILDIPASDDRLSNSHWIRSKYTMFQCKAQKMDDRACYKEVIQEKSKPKNLKKQVKNCLDSGGNYILFTTDSMTDATIDNRIKSIRKAFADCKAKDTDKANVEVFDANQIVRWANEFLKAVIYVQSCRGIARLGQFRTWDQWYEAYLTVKQYEYQETETLKDYKLELYDKLETDKVVRVIGHKGLGKTRFVLECFNMADPNQNIVNLSKTLVYIDLALAEPKNLTSFLIDHGHIEGIIVVDNCSDEWHDSFLPLVKTGKLKMITINDSWFNNKPNTFVIDRRMQRDVVRMIFSNCFKGLNDSEINHLVKISEGFPEMVPFIDNIIQGKDAALLYTTIPSDFITKFLFAGQRNEAEYELFKACSVFTEFSFYDDKIEDILSNSEKDNIKNQNKLIYERITKQPLDKGRFYQFCIKYRDKRTLLEKKGRNYSVIPEPIAVNLAAEWWEETSFDYVKSINKELNDVGLLIPMIDRLRALDQSERAKSIVSKAWGPNGPFSTAEVLNTELGSRLFRSVVEVNPIVTLDALNFAFADLTTVELRTSLREGRRNVVWALEKLAFRKETFVSAAKMLCKLSAAENENYGNNATGQFLQLFHIYLAGTEANYTERLSIIEWGLVQEDIDIQYRCISAAGHGLKSHGFHRTIGAEEQGLGKRLKEFQPDTWAEIYDYWNAIIELLVNAARQHLELRSSVKNTLSSAIRSMFGNGQSENITKAIREVYTLAPELWSEAIDALKKAKNYEELQESDIALIRELINFLTPQDLKDRFTLLVIKPEWEYSARDLDENIVQKKAEAFADEIIGNQIDISQYLNDLLSGEQRQTFAFGAKLAKIDNLDLLVTEILRVLSNISEQQQNPALLAGIISNVSADKQRKILQEVISYDNLIRHVFYLIRLIEPDKAEIDQLFELVDQGKANIVNFEGFRYGRALDRMGQKEVTNLFRRVATYGTSGAWTSFLLMAQYCYQEEPKWELCKGLMRDLLMQHNIFTEFEEARNQDEYLWSTYLLKLLKDSDDLELAEIVSEQIRMGSEERDFPVHDSSLRDVVRVLCRQYFKVFWNIINSELIGNGLSYFKFKTLLGSHNGVRGSDGILFEGDHDEIIKWCKVNKPKGPYRIGYMMPLFAGDAWSTFALKMIDEFGKDEKFLNEVAANMGSFSMVGTSKKYFSRIIGMAEVLLDHKFATVRKWAKNCIIHYEKQIRREQLDEEQRG